MPTTDAPRQLTSADRRAIYGEQFGRALAKLTPNCPGGRYSGQQVAYAKGQARRLTEQTIAEITGER